MITRVWHGKTNANDAAKYLEFLLDEGTTDYRKTNGNLSAKVWMKKSDDVAEFYTVTEWTNLEAVKAFAGEEYEVAKYYPFDKDMLLEFEPTSMHAECYDVSNTKIRSYITQLNELYHGGNWVHESFKGKLDHLRDEIAFTQPMPGVHSIAELVWHCIYWRTVTYYRLQGAGNRYRDETYDEQNFLPLEELKRRGWKYLLDELSKTQETLISFLKDKTDRFLDNVYEEGLSFEFLINGTIQHDYYHLGQIGLVARMVKG